MLYPHITFVFGLTKTHEADEVDFEKKSSADERESYTSTMSEETRIENKKQSRRKKAQAFNLN